MPGKTFYGEGIPGINPRKLKGAFIVIEGPDCSGRSTQVQLLRNFLELKGHAVADVGLRASRLISKELEQAKNTNDISPRTLSLFYSTDFADQLENKIVPALEAGYIVIADRYIYTLMARDLVRGANRDWLESIYGIAIVPDAVFYLRVNPQTLVERTFMKYGSFHFWESGMDLHISREWYPCFMGYQRRLQTQYRLLGQQYDFHTINGNRSVTAINRQLCREVEELLILQEQHN
jgi:dTMP kinase